MTTEIHVLIDHDNGTIRKSSLEALALGQKLAAERQAVLCGLIFASPVQPLVEQVRRYAMERLYAAQDEKLASYDPDSYQQALEQVVREFAPGILLMAHSYQNIDLAPRLAAALESGLVTDCIGFKSNSEGLIFVRQMFRNKLNADVRVLSRPPWLITVQKGAFSSDDLKEGSPEVVQFPVDLSSVRTRRTSVERFEAGKGRVDLSQADVIVAVGRGIKKAENMKIIEELAAALGAEIGASRPVVDNGWLGRERQIGSSGQNVSPKLYIAAGISGAIQHVVGMKGSACIVAINSDARAPIFNVANYGIVGDLFQIIPALTRKLKEE